MAGRHLFEFAWERGDKQTCSRLRISVGTIAMLPLVLLVAKYAGGTRLALQVLYWVVGSAH